MITYDLLNFINPKLSVTHFGLYKVSMTFSVDQHQPGLPRDVLAQPVHQGGDLPLAGVVGDQTDQHGVPAETLQAGKDGKMLVEERVCL